MTDRPAPRGVRPSSRQPDDDGWGPSTAVYSATERSATERRGGAGRQNGQPARDEGFARAFTPQQQGGRGGDDGRAEPWSQAGAPSRDKQRANRQMERQIAELRSTTRPKERGWPWWAALGLLIVIAVIGGVIDTVGSIQVRGGFNIGIVVASIVAILVVRRSHMFPIVIAPPIVYSLAAVFQLYLRSSGLHDKKVVFDAAANYLVYGFPAIAAATAAVLIIAGFRLITRK